MASRFRNFWQDNNARHPYYYEDASVNGYSLSLIAKEQPKYVCRDCGGEFGYWTSVGQGVDKGYCTHHILKETDYHMDNCDCCGKEFSVTDVKHYGYFYDGWQDKKK